MKKNIATLTWFSGNYGSVLQAYALQNILIKLGYENDIINYSPTLAEKISFFISCGAKKAIIKDKVTSLRLKEKALKSENRDKIAKFNDFSRRMKFTDIVFKRQDELKKIKDKYSFYICGSDQIWNPDYFKKCNYLDFVSDNKSKISYAPSVGVTSLNSREAERIKPLINRIDHLSVREECAKKIIEQITDKSVAVVCDPVILLTSEEWCDRLILPGAETEKYILVYLLSENKSYQEVIRYAAKHLKMKVKVIPISYNDYLLKNHEKAVGPVEWINLIYNAEIIFTDSFHATAFSVIFNKNFYTFNRFNDSDIASQNSRISNFLKNIGLNDRILTAKSSKMIKEAFISPGRWDSVNCLIDRIRNESLQWLRSSLSE